MWMIRGSPRTPHRLPDYLAFVYSGQRFLGQYNDGYTWASIIWVVLPQHVRHVGSYEEQFDYPRCGSHERAQIHGLCCR
jgi:hypothetical protein